MNGVMNLCAYAGLVGSTSTAITMASRRLHIGGFLCVKQSDDLFDRDAAMIGWLQRKESSSVRCRVVEPLGSKPAVGSTHDQHVRPRSVVRPSGGLHRSMIADHRSVYRRGT